MRPAKGRREEGGNEKVNLQESRVAVGERSNVAPKVEHKKEKGDSSHMTEVTRSCPAGYEGAISWPQNWIRTMCIAGKNRNGLVSTGGIPVPHMFQERNSWTRDARILNCCARPAPPRQFEEAGEGGWGRTAEMSRWTREETDGSSSQEERDWTQIRLNLLSGKETGAAETPACFLFGGGQLLRRSKVLGVGTCVKQVVLPDSSSREGQAR